MGTIISSIKDVESIHWTKLKKGQIAKAKSVMFITDTAAIVQLENGTFTVIGQHHGPNNNWAVLGYGLDHFTQAVLNGLVRLGILDRKQISEHIRTAEQRQKALQRRDHIRWLTEICEKLDIPVPEVK